MRVQHGDPRSAHREDEQSPCLMPEYSINDQKGEYSGKEGKSETNVAVPCFLHKV